MNTTATEKTILLSKHGMKELKKTIAHLTHDRLKAIETLRELDKTTGHEERLERIEKLAHLEAIESELAEKEYLLQTAKPLPTKRARLKVEANPSDGKISIVSPLGQSLVGKTTRDIVQWSTGLGAKQLQLVRVM